MPESNLIPAAQYLRMSTEHQQYSLAHQADAIQRYAMTHSFSVVRTYSDGGKSGVVLRYRHALKQLLRDVLEGENDYEAILVYDISRWGRFQDSDEAAHYEFLCKQAGIPVYYCEEQFANDGSFFSSIVKVLKRSMAAEYSRELSVKCFAGQKRLAELGFRVGGQAGFGLRRLLVSSAGKPKHKLQSGEYKGFHTDRIVLVPGPSWEVRVVREMFEMALHMNFSAILRDLNARGVKFLNGRPWKYDSVYRLLTNPKYCGCNVWGRTSQKLKRPQRIISDPSHWIVRENCFEPLVSREMFDRVQAALHKRKSGTTDRILLSKLRKLLERKASLSEDIMHRAGLPSKSTYVRHFGSIMAAYRLVGYKPTSRQLNCEARFAQTMDLRKLLLNELQFLFPGRVTPYKLNRFGPRRAAIQLDTGLVISILLCTSYLTPTARRRRWELLPSGGTGLTLVCLLNRTNQFVDFSYLFARMDKQREYQVKDLSDPWLASAERLESMTTLYDAALRLDSNYRRLHTPQVPPRFAQWPQ